ncbi:spermidine synthase [Thalassotalea sp. 42_200_T64]|nr:spermidine synthase [Thalassotalea sp. 42_200_T64]
MQKYLYSLNLNLSRFIALAIFISASFTTQAKVIKEERSLYRNIFVEDKGNVRCLKFSVKRKTSSQSCINKDNPQKLVFNYTKYVMSSLVFIPNPQKVLIIGLGGGTLSNSLLELYPQIEIDNVEIDPAVVRVAKNYFDFKETDKVRSHTKDGRIFIKRAQRKQQRYDLIILDAFNGEYIPEHLLTQEFLEETKSLLTEQGVLVANTFSSSKLFHHESATYHAVFGDFYSISNENSSGNRVIIIPNKMPLASEIGNNVETLTLPLAKYDIKLFNVISFMDLEKDVESDYRVLTDQYSPANLL